MLLPLRVGGFNKRWTVGLWQVAGWVSSKPIYGEHKHKHKHKHVLWMPRVSHLGSFEAFL
jgi:hypothetical protein